MLNLNMGYYVGLNIRILFLIIVTMWVIIIESIVKKVVP